MTLEHGRNLALFVYIRNKERQSVVLSAFSKERITLSLWQFLEARCLEWEQTREQCEMSSAEAGLMISKLSGNEG